MTLFLGTYAQGLLCLFIHLNLKQSASMHHLWWECVLINVSCSDFTMVLQLEFSYTYLREQQ